MIKLQECGRLLAERYKNTCGSAMNEAATDWHFCLPNPHSAHLGEFCRLRLWKEVACRYIAEKSSSYNHTNSVPKSTLSVSASQNSPKIPVHEHKTFQLFCSTVQTLFTSQAVRRTPLTAEALFWLQGSLWQVSCHRETFFSARRCPLLHHLIICP
jgi:hypothetical protein